MTSFSRSGMIVDIVSRTIFPGTCYVANGKIVSIAPGSKNDIEDCYILPGFIDAHVHIESSMLIPSEFARLASVHGTVATISDPHEIANVLGVDGIRYMIDNGNKVPFHFYFGASSCVPATTFETAGAEVSAGDIETLFNRDGLKYLSEMMNFPGVLNDDPMVMEKLNVAKRLRRPIDGHSPGLRGPQATKYIHSGISTDHECYTLEEGLEKASQGMHIIIREGSAAKNYEALHPLIRTYPAQVMFCSDDKHPDALVQGHINDLVKRSVIDYGYDLMDVLRAASFNPVKHYGLDVGLLQRGDSADFIVVDNLQAFNVLETFVKGECIAKQGTTSIASVPALTPNYFHVLLKKEKDFAIPAVQNTKYIRVIDPEDGQLITKTKLVVPKVVDGLYVADPGNNLLKLTVVNRYQNVPPAVAFIANFGLKRGAIASCVAHDSHNIIAVGCTDKDLTEAVNLLIQQKGGIAVVDKGQKYGLPLPVAGIMSNEEGYHVAEKYAEMDARAKALGSTLHAPFMTLSFMALLVIPSLKLSDQGLFDGNKFSFTSLSKSSL